MKLSFTSLALLAAALQTVAAQTPLPQAPQFQTNVDIVAIDVSVTRNGVPVSGLRPEDFEVLDEGTPRRVDTAVLETSVPLDLQLVLDTSQSVSGDRLSHMISAAREAVRALRAGDRVALITFSDIVRVRRQTTDDFASVNLALGTLTSAGGTAVKDAVGLALSLHRPSAAARPLMILFSDGVDNLSWLSDEEVVESARRAGVVTHVVNVAPPGSDEDAFLKELTRATGGRTLTADTDRDLERVFVSALNDMRSRYLLTFAPAGPVKPGWHQLKVRLKTGRADIAARAGYLASP